MQRHRTKGYETNQHRLTGTEVPLSRGKGLGLGWTVVRGWAMAGLLASGMISDLMIPTPVAADPVAAEAIAHDLAANPRLAASTRLEISLRQRRLVVYQGDVAIRSYMIGIGRPGWETPIGEFRVLQKKRNPTWINPFTNESIPANDPRNPLGGYWIGFWTDGNNWIGFHGTPDTTTIGQAASHGCIHMRRSDLQALFEQVSPGVPVTVVP